MADPDRLSPEESGHRSLGAFCILVGAGGLWIAKGYDFGTFIAMGPGFVPRVVSGCLVLLGILIIVNGGRDVRHEEPLPPIHGVALLRIASCVIGSVVLFGLALRPLGLAAAVFLMVALAMLAQRGVRAPTLLLTAAALSAFAVVLFPILLGINIPILPRGAG